MVRSRRRFRSSNCIISFSGGLQKRSRNSSPTMACRGRARDFFLPPAQIPACGFPAPGSCRRSGAIGRARGLLRSADPQAGDGDRMRGPVLRPEHRQSPTIPPTEPPSLHALRRRSSRPCSGASPVPRGSSELLACSTAASAPRLPAAARDRHSDCGPDEVSQVPTRSFRA